MTRTKKFCKRGLHFLSGKNLYVRPNGRRLCRKCANITKRKRLAAAPEKYRAYRRKRYAADPEKYRARRRKWRAANPERCRAQNRKWHATHPAERISQFHPNLSKVALGKLGEKLVADYFKEQGYAVEPQKPSAPFDLLLRDGGGGQYRVEVRWAQVPRSGRVHVGKKKNPSKYDLFVAVKPDGEMVLF